MKNLRISLNGQVYDVQVEVLADDESRYPGGSVPTKVPLAAPALANPAPAPVAPRPAPVQAAGGGSLVAPIVGSVTQILVEVGATVQENQPVLVLDAMKMDTYINAPKTSTVAAIHCRIGETVQVGQKLISFT